MNKVVSFLFLLTILIPFDSNADLQKETSKILDRMPNQWREANLRAWTNDGGVKNYKLGESIKFYFYAERDCFITMVYVDSRGLVSVILPDLGKGDNRLRAGLEASYPPKNATYQVIAEPPLGRDNVYVIATQYATSLAEQSSYSNSNNITQQISHAILNNREAHKTAIVKLIFEVQARSEQIEYKTRDIVSYFSKTRALRPISNQGEQPRIYLDLHINFEFESAALSWQAKKNLDEFGKSMLDPSLQGHTFIIAGHTDDIGAEDYNMELSRRRANEVKNYLVTQFGLNPDNLLIEAHGESKPYNLSKTEEARAINRRVEFEMKP